jgi:pimeloyl-ACP methyl ester carboxylesterase
LELYALLLHADVNVFAFDYRGYGRSEGRPGEEGTYKDAQAAYGWLQQRGFVSTNIIAYGESLGGAVASELAVRETVGGLILQSTFTSLTDLGAELYPFLPVRSIGSIGYDTHSRLPRIRVPVLILHSRGDRLIPFHHAEQNFAAANEPKWLCEIAGDHNDGLDDRETFAAGIEQLLHRMDVGK